MKLNTNALAVSPREAASIIGIGVTKLYEIANKPDGLALRKLGGRSVVLKRDIEAFLDQLPLAEVNKPQSPK